MDIVFICVHTLQAYANGFKRGNCRFAFNKEWKVVEKLKWRKHEGRKLVHKRFKRKEKV